MNVDPKKSSSVNTLKIDHKVFITSSLALLFCLWFKPSKAQKLDSLQQLNEVVVKATRANERTGMVYTNVSQNTIKKQNLGQDMPFILNSLPSVVVTSDAGAGVGYTGIRIRGTDPTRINVTINGIPYNDSESQSVYWVNMPDIASSVQSLQIQRGVGTSTNGSGAFGASINVNTLQLNPEPFAEINTSVGSFNTLKTNFLASSGLLNNKFAFDARLSKITSDGYIDRATSNLQSYYLSGGYYHKNNFVRLNHFLGKEITYQAWNGIPQALANGNLAELDAYIERNGYDQTHKQELLARGRKYNYYNYENEIDHYLQSHWQLISSFELSKNWRFNPTLFYTTGDGYYEQFKERQDLKKYLLKYINIGSETIKKSDLIRRKYLDNNFYGGVWSLDYEARQKLSATIGGGFTKYNGDHFGEVIWAKYFSDGKINHRYYENISTKTDVNIYGKVYYNFTPKWNVFADLQFRTVSFDMLGTGDVLQNLNFKSNWNFLNPKLGFTFDLSDNSQTYLSYAKGSKEPNRSDFVDTAPSVPSPEKLHDFELGYKFKNNNWMVEANAYYMHYKDQLVLTGQINQTGEAIRINVPKSYRTGIELQIGKKVTSQFTAQANLTLSQNKIRQFIAVTPSYDETPEERISLKNTDISFSPNTIAGGNFTYAFSKHVMLSLLPKYVGKQYLDNTSSKDKMLSGYFLTDALMNYTPKLKTLKDVALTLQVNNIFNKKYESNGYTYSYISGSKITENFVFPQAGSNFLIGLRARF